MKYRSEIDGLRALAILPVILFHAGFERFKGGFVGVDVFFVISGYLITTIIISEMAGGKFNIFNFYERRARRILPALFFIMAVSIPFAFKWLNPNDLKDFGQSLMAVSTFSSNILFWWERDYFDTASEMKPFLHTWSLAVEEQYYIIFPLFIMLSWRLGAKWILIILSTIFILSLGLAQWSIHSAPTAAFYLLPTRAWEIILGVFAAFYLKNCKLHKLDSFKQIFSIIGFCMIIYSIFAFDEATPFPSFYTLIPTVGTLLLILFATPNTLMHSILSLKPLVGLGLISYSAYLWHHPILAFAKHRFFGEISVLLLATLCIVSIILAWFTWKFIEQPFRSKHDFSQKLIFMSLIISISLFSFLGGIFHLYSQEVSKQNSSFNYAVWQSWNELDMQRRSKILAGICQFNGIDGITNINNFVKNHSCRPKIIDDNTILVFGDSVSADAAHSLRYLTKNIIQLGGAGCQILPNNSCKEIYTKLDELLSMGVSKIILANHISYDGELSKSYLKDTADFFSNYNVSVLLLPPPLIFKKINCPFFYFCSEEVTYTEEYYDKDIKSPISKNFYLAPPFSLGCNASPAFPSTKFCDEFFYYSNKNIFLRTDGFHLNENGAIVFADYLGEVINQVWGIDLMVSDKIKNNDFILELND